MAQNLRNDPNKLVNRLKKIEYQVLRGIPEGLLTDEIRLRVARAIVDSVIDDDTAVVDSEMPEDILGVDLDWGAGSAANDAVVGFSIGSLSETADLETGEDFTGEGGGGNDVYDWTTASESKIVASDAEANDQFGSSVSISGDYAIVSSPRENEGGDYAGAAYIFHKTGTNTWDAGTKIVATDPEENDFFGRSVSISGDYAIVGADYESEVANRSGAAYIFYNDGNGWNTGTKIIAPDAAGNDYFGNSVSIDGAYAAVGAWSKNVSSPSDGAAYIFYNDGNGWDAGTKIVAPDAEAGDYFGYSISIFGDYVIVGARGRNSFEGTAYIFHRTGTNTWDAGTKIVATDPEENDFFGSSVSISGDYAIVGSPGEEEGGYNSGAVYIFHRTGTNTWDAGTKIIAPDAAGSENFGQSVSISGDYAIVGADNESAAYVFYNDGNGWDTGTKIIGLTASGSDRFGNSVSIDGDYAIVGSPRDDDAGGNAGAAYIFKAG